MCDTGLHCTGWTALKVAKVVMHCNCWRKLDAESCVIVHQWRNKVRSQQYECEKELSDHAVVIKELQKVIGDERIVKEQMENQVQNHASCA